MDKINRFFKTAIVYLTGNLLSKMVAFFLLPLYTSRLLPEQYGTYDLVLSLINLIAPIAFFQIWDGMFRFAFDYSSSKEKYGVISNAIVTYSFGIATYVALFSLLEVIFHFECFYYALAYGFFFALQYLFTYISRVFLRNTLFVASGIVNTITSALINIVLITKYGWGVESLYLAPTIGCILQIAIIDSRIKIVRNFKPQSINIDDIKKMLRFSLPLCAATVSYWLLTGLSKVIISTVLGAYDNGLYAVANRFGSMIALAVSVFQFAWNETAYLMARNTDRKEIYSKCIEFMLKIVIYGCAVVCLLIKLLFPIMIDEKYNEALFIIPAVIIGVSFNSMAGFLGTLFMTEKRTSFILTSTLAASLINCSLGYICARMIGLQGVVIVLAIAFGFLMSMRLAKLRNELNIRIPTSIAVHFLPLSIGVFLYYLSSNTTITLLSIFTLLTFSALSIAPQIRELLALRRAERNHAE